MAEHASDKVAVAIEGWENRRFTPSTTDFSIDSSGWDVGKRTICFDLPANGIVRVLEELYLGKKRVRSFNLPGAPFSSDRIRTQAERTRVRSRFTAVMSGERRSGRPSRCIESFRRRSRTLVLPRTQLLNRVINEKASGEPVGCPGRCRRVERHRRSSTYVVAPVRRSVFHHWDSWRCRCRTRLHATTRPIRRSAC